MEDDETDGGFDPGRDDPGPGRPGPEDHDHGGRGGYRRASEAVWACARADYLAGDTAEAVCARHDLRLSTLRARAAAQGWRRLDQPDPEPVDLEAEVRAGLPAYADLAGHALVRAHRAILRGRAAEAAGWTRLHARLIAMARPANDASAPREARPEADPYSPQAFARRARTARALGHSLTGLDPRDPQHAQIIAMGLDCLENLAAISDGSDDSDAVFSDDGV